VFQARTRFTVEEVARKYAASRLVVDGLSRGSGRSTGGSRGAGGLDERRALRLLISRSELCRPESSTPSCGQEARRAGTAARSDARVPGRARCARTRRAPAARGRQRSATVSGFYYVACRSAYFASATLRAVGAVSGHLVRTLRRRLDAPASACCGARRRRLPRASRSSNVRTAPRSPTGTYVCDRSRRWPNDRRWGRRCGRAPPSRPELLGGHPQSCRRVGCAASPLRFSGCSGPCRADLTMRTLSVRARRLEATICPLTVVEASPAARPLEPSPLALGLPASGLRRIPGLKCPAVRRSGARRDWHAELTAVMG
jgi:hypothetical protein